MKAPLSYVPSLPAMAGIIIGILAYMWGIGIWGIGVFAVVFAALYFFKQHYWAFISLFAAIGLIMGVAHKPAEVPQWVYTGNHTYTAKLLTINESGNVTIYHAEINRIDGVPCQDIKAQVIVRSVQRGPQPAATIEFRGSLVPVSNTQGTGVPYEIDYNKYLATEGIYSHITVNTVSEIEGPDAVDSAINSIRDGIYNAIVYSPINGPTASFILATAMGDDTYVTQAKYDQYRALGIAHILALSGLHVGILVAFVAMLLYPLNMMKRGSLLRSALTIALIWAYTVIVGFAPSIVRAAVMISVFVCARHIQRGYNALNSLFLSVTIILCINPMWIGAPGFQLSVAAVSAILIFGNVIPATLKRYPPLYYILNMMAISVAAMLGTGIVSAYYFNSFAGMFLLGNIVTGLLFPWILVGGVVLAAFTACGISLSWLGTVVDGIYWLMETAIDYLASFDGAYVRGLFISAWIFIPYWMTLVAAAYALRRKSLKAWLSTIILLLCTVITWQCTSDAAPAAELYIPRNSRSTDILMRSGQQAWLVSYGADPEDRVTDCNIRYRNFLLRRGCGESFTPMYDHVSTHNIKADRHRINIGETAISVIDSDTIRVYRGRRPTYAVITDGYKGDVTTIERTLKPDTIVIGGGIHHNRRKEMVEQCGDSIPYIDLRQRHISIIY